MIPLLVAGGGGDQLIWTDVELTTDTVTFPGACEGAVTQDEMNLS